MASVRPRFTDSNNHGYQRVSLMEFLLACRMDENVAKPAKEVWEFPQMPISAESKLFLSDQFRVRERS